MLLLLFASSALVASGVIVAMPLPLWATTPLRFARSPNGRGREAVLLQVNHAPPGHQCQWSEEVAGDAPHVVQRHYAEAQPHARGEEPAGLDQPPQGERDGLGLSRGPARLKDEDDLVEPANARVPAVAPRGPRRQREIQRRVAPSPPFEDDQRDAGVGACSDGRRLGTDRTRRDDDGRPGPRGPGRPRLLHSSYVLRRNYYDLRKGILGYLCNLLLSTLLAR